MSRTEQEQKKVLKKMPNEAEVQQLVQQWQGADNTLTPDGFKSVELQREKIP